MPLSSPEYIKALREGKYLLFLQWTDFIAQKYRDDSVLLDADTMANLLIFEWLDSSYSEEDAKKFSILYAISELESNPLEGKLDYSLKVISVALFLCMVFQENNLQVTYIAQNKLTRYEIDQLVKQNIDLLDPIIYKASLTRVQTQFFQWVENVDKKEVDASLEKIYPIITPKHLLEEYVLHLERIKMDDDVLYTSRLSMAKSFLAYLYKQTELTPEVTQEIMAYTNAIREMHPTQWEAMRLDHISPPSLLKNTWRWFTGLGLSFFSVVLQEKSISELISGTPDPRS